MLLVYSQGWVVPLVGETVPADSSGLVRMMFIPAYLIGLGLLVLAPWDVAKATARQPFMVLLLVIAALSITWSIAPDQTTRRVIAVTLTTLSGIALAVRYRWSGLAEVLAGAFAVLALASFAAGLLFPSMGRMTELFPGAWRGLWPEKNALGGNMTLAFLTMAAAALLNPRRAILWWGASALAVALVALSTSKTSLVALLLGIGAIVFVSLLQRGAALKVATLWAAAVGVGLATTVAAFGADAVLGLLGKDATFTGRTLIWDAAMRQIELRPWSGYGYGAVWTTEGPWSPLAWIVHQAGFKPQHAHNSWLEQWLGMGVFGLAAFALMWLQTLLLAGVAAFRERGAYLAVPFLLVYGAMTLTESVAVAYNDLRWVLFVVVAVKLSWPDRSAGLTPRPSDARLR